MAPPSATPPTPPAAPSADAAREAERLRQGRGAFWIMIGVWLAFDLLSKEAMFAYLHVPPDAEAGGPYGRTVWVLDGLLRWSAQINAGAAFGMGRDAPWAILLLTAALLPAMVCMVYANRVPRAPVWALGAVVGGALGNLYDRLFETGVRDFIDFVKPWSPDETIWPVFNVADIGIVGGVLAYLLWTMRQPSAPAPAAPPAAPPSGESTSAETSGAHSSVG